MDASSNSTTTTEDNNDLPHAVVDHVVNTWIDVLKNPTVSEGHFLEDDHFLNISTLWSVNDPSKKEPVKFQRNFSLLKSCLSWDEDNKELIKTEKLIMTQSAATPFDGKIICISRDGSRKAILMEKNSSSSKDSSSNNKVQFIQVWNKDTLLKSYDLSELDKHKSVYTCGDFGTTMTWNEKGDKLAYLAEKKIPKPRPFFSSDVSKDDNDNSDNKNVEMTPEPRGPKGEEYALNQTWGEQMQDMYFSVVVILDIQTDKFKVIEFSSDQFPTDISWSQDNSIIGTAYIIPDWRLGLIYCTNRESRIFQINEDGSNFRFLSCSGRAAFCPRVRPGDNKFVIWQERAVDAPHNRARNIMGISLSEPLGLPNCLYESVAPNLPIYENFRKQCWARDGSVFFVIAVNDGILSLLSLSPNNDGKVETKYIFTSSPGIDDILWIGDNYMLLSRSSTLSFPYIELVEISGGNRRVALTKSKYSVPNNGTYTYSIKKLFGLASIPSFYVGPEDAPPRTVPLIVWPHGGPHACFVDSFMHESTFLARLGYAFLKVNYIGSTGASKGDETDDLLGKIGTLDVQDSQGIVEKALQTFPCIDPQKIGVWGGSHGGFLTCHLISQFPDFYKAAVARNPVIDLNTMLGQSDIADWCLAEVGIPFFKSLNVLVPAAKSPEETEKLFKASPISHVSKVKAATLLCIGTQDLRVPPSQGLQFYRALKAYGKTTEVRVYPDCHPLSNLAVKIDNVIHSVLWFKKFIK